MRPWTAAVAALLASATLASTTIVSATAAKAATGYKVIDRIPGPDGFWDYIRVDAKNNRVLLTHGTSVMAVDLATKAVSSFAPGGRLHIALPVNGGSEVLVTNGGANAAEFYDLKGAKVASVDTGKGPDDAAVEPRTGLLMVIDHAGGQVTLIDGKAHKAVGTIEVGGDLEEAAVDGTGKAYINVENKSEIAVVDVPARKVTARWALEGCEGPTGLAYDAADKLLLAACDGATAVVDARTGKVVQTVATGKGADGIAFDAKQKLAFVPAGRAGTLSVISMAGGKATVVDTVPTQISARTIALDERTGRLYLPAAKYAPAAAGGRPTVTPGTFEVLVVGK
jgi:DNA-binding beta-propeller fold protein YncE